MKTIFYSVISIYLCFQSKAQNAFPYLFSEQIETRLKSDTNANRFQNAASRYCEIGNYRKAKIKLESGDQLAQIELSGADSNMIRLYSYFNARPLILKNAKDKQIVMMNEDENDPKHRAFTESLLLELYNNGFRYLAIEGLAQADKSINKRKFPTLRSGVCVKESQMANLMRTALFIGFKLVAYTPKKYDTSGDKINKQVKNLAKLFKKDPKAKVLMHCRAASIYETENKDQEKALASKIKEVTGIDPLTINQAMYKEKSTRDKSDAVLRKLILIEPSVMINDQGQFFTTLDQSKAWDICVFHPFSKYVFGRPAWLTSGVARLFKEIPNKPAELSYPYLALAYLENEYSNKDAVPVDIIEIENENDKKQMVLYLGNYQLVMQDKDGKKIVQKFAVEYKQP
jgi:hypothetical protein